MWIRIDDTLINLDNVQKIFINDVSLKFISNNDILFSKKIDDKETRFKALNDIFEALTYNIETFKQNI